MQPRPYPRRTPGPIQSLMSDGVIRRRPFQVDAQDLSGADGIDIVYEFTRGGLTPDRFGRHIDQLLVAAEYESNRYSDLDYRSARFEVELLTQGARPRGRTRRRQIRDYIAAMRADTDDMVYGESGSIPVELGGQGRSLSDKAEAILYMLETGSPGAYVDQQNPYRVLRMVISVRTFATAPARRQTMAERIARRGQQRPAMG